MYLPEKPNRPETPELPLAHFKALFPRCRNSVEIVAMLNKYFDSFGLNTQEKISAFISQCGHESGGFTRFDENLNYSAKALNAVFSKYFRRAGVSAEEYARQPEKIANRVYGNRMGNGDEASGDGFKFKGRGVVMLTGKNNYRTFGEDLGIDVMSNPNIVSENMEVCVMTGFWFWKKNGLVKYSNRENFKTLTKRINGGYNGMQDRVKKFEKSMKLWS